MTRCLFSWPLLSLWQICRFYLKFHGWEEGDGTVQASHPHIEFALRLELALQTEY